VAFDPAQIGIKGSPTVVSKAYTPSPKEAGEMVQVSERGTADAVAYALKRIVQARAIDF
jgi:electron transfer flavoprotein beta subunit